MLQDNKINILHVIASNFYGGPEKQIIFHCKFYDKNKYHISVASFIEGNSQNEFVDILKKDNIPAFAINHKFLFDLSIISQLKKIITNNNIDILITHGYKSNIIGYYANRSCGIPHAMYVRGWTAEGWKIKLYNKLEVHYLKKADLIVTVAKSKENNLIKLGIKSKQIRSITNAVELPGLSSLNGISLKDEFNIHNNKLLILAAGRLSPEKGHEQLIYALHELYNSEKSFKCIIFGDGPLKSELIKLRDKLNLKDNIIFAGFYPDWKIYLNEANLLINPSLSEVMPNVVLESLSHKCPVIATDVGGVKELIIDGKTGFLAEANNPHSIYKCIIKYLANRDKISEIVENGYKHVVNNFSFEKQADKLHDLYNELYQVHGNK